MVNYKEYLGEYYLRENIMNEELKNAYGLVSLLVISEVYNSKNPYALDELVTEGINDILGKLGLSLHKHNPGVIEYIKLFTKGVGKIIYAAIKGDKDGVKNIAKTLKKEDVIDFILKLDMLTLHVITGPIHMIDALTGWDLSVHIKKTANSAGNMLGDLKKTISELKYLIKKTFMKEVQQIAFNKVKEIEQIIPKKI